IHRTSLISICCFLASAATASLAIAAPFTTPVTIDTSTIATQYGYLDLQFNPAVVSGQQSATATVTNITGGTDTNPSDSNNGTIGSVTVNPAQPAPLTPATTIGFDTSSDSSPNDYTEDQTFGSQLTFNVALGGPQIESANGNGGGTTFYISILDGSFNSLLPTSDPNGYLGYITIDQNGNVTTHSESADLTFTQGTSGGGSVPEPSSMFLLTAGGLGLWTFTRLRASTAKR